MRPGTNQQPDFTPTVLAVKQSGADVVCTYFTFENDLALFARQLRQLGIGAAWIGSPTITYTTTLKLAGGALHGTYGVTDFAIDANPEARSFADRFEQLYKEKPDVNAAWTYDGLMVLANGINKAGSTDPEKVRSAVLAIQGFKGIEGHPFQGVDYLIIRFIDDENISKAVVLANFYFVIASGSSSPVHGLGPCSPSKPESSHPGRPAPTETP